MEGLYYSTVHVVGKDCFLGQRDPELNRSNLDLKWTKGFVSASCFNPTSNTLFVYGFTIYNKP